MPRAPDDPTEATAITVVEPRAVETTAPLPTVAKTVEGTLASPAQPERLIDHFPVAATGRYDAVDEVGRGATGRVLLAEDVVLGRPVAIKELHSPRGEGARRFAREVMITAKLEHPSIIPVHDAGRRPDGSPFYVMKLVRGGRTFASAMEECRTLSDRLALLPQVLAIAHAIAFAHARGIVHRDLKPANVLLGAFGETIVADWGLAKDLNGEDASAEGEPEPGPARSAFEDARGPEDATQAGDILGTPAYMAPEQARSEPADRRSDVFAIGAILYRLLSGRRLYEDTDSQLALLMAIVSGPPKPLAELVPNLPADLLAIVAKAMARAPEDRFASAGELADDLEAFLKGRLVSAHRYSRLALFLRWVRRHRASVSVALAALVLLTVLGALSIVSVVKERNVARLERQRAVDAKVSAQARLAELYEEQGRQALVAGDAPRALLYLTESYALGQREPRLRFLLGRAAVVLDETASPPAGHTAGVSVAEWAPDGARVVTASADGTARVWSAATGEEQAVFRGATGPLLDAAVARDGARVAVSGASGAWLFDPADGRSIATLAEHENLVLSARFSPDGSKVVSGDGDGVLRVWRSSDGQRLGALTAHTGPIDLVTFDRSGARLLSVSADRTGAVWDVATMTLVRRLAADQSEIMSGAFSPDGTQVSTCGFDSDLRVWSTDVSSPPKVFTEPKGWIFACPFSPDGRLVAGATADQLGVLWDPESGRATTLRGHLGEVLDIAFSPDGAFVATASKDGSARVWDATSGLTVATLAGHEGWVKSVRFAPDSQRIATGSEDATTRLWDARTGRLLQTLRSSTADAHTDSRWKVAELSGASDVVATVAVDDSGRRAVTASYDGAARIYSLPDGALLRELRGPTGRLVGARFGRGGSVVSAGTTDPTLQLWDAETGAPRATLRGHTGDLNGIDVDGNGEQVISSSADGTARVWSTSDAHLVAVLEGHRGSVDWATLSRDGRRALTVSDDRTARVWELPSGRLEKVLEAHASPIWSGAFDDAGRLACTASVDHTAGIWDVQSGALLHRLRGHAAPVLRCRFSPDGTLLATASQDGAKVWSVETGALRFSLKNDDAVNDALFTPDGAFLVTAGQQGLARVWDARSGKLLTTLRGHHDWLSTPALAPDGRFLVTPSADHTARVWDLHLEERDAAWLEETVRCRVRLRLQDSIAVASDPPGDCP